MTVRQSTQPVPFELRKLDELCGIEGFDDLDALVQDSLFDSVAPAICVNPENPECTYTAEMEPDQDRGWCENCNKNTMKSALILGGLI